MTTVLNSFRRVALAAACCALASVSWAAAPDDLPVPASAPAATVAPPIGDYALQTQMVVHNWVLCVSEPVAEKLARARVASVDDARAVYADLAKARTCGQFAELNVILREKLFGSASDSSHDTRVFAALVNLSGSWASGFVVSGSLPED